MNKHLFRMLLWVAWFSLIWGVRVEAEYSQVINITWFNIDAPNQLIQSFTQKRDDLELYFLSNTWSISHYTIMDRNMWATEIYNWIFDSQNEESYWYVYQRWNNYWFTPTSTQTLAEPTRWGVAKEVWEKYIPSKYWRNAHNTSANWMLNASTTDWIWWWTWDTSLANGSGTIKEWRKWPCPNWYYIPSSKDWSDIITWYTSKESMDNIWEQIGWDLLMPAAGNRAWGNWGNTVGYVGELGCYRSSSPYEYSTNYAYSFNFSATYANPRSSSYRSQWRPVRCKKNSANNIGFVLHPNGWTWAVIVFTWNIDDGIFTTLWSPNRWNSIFFWWYSTPDFQEWTKIEKWDTVVPSLYAKWGCSEWYESNRGNTGCLEIFNMLYELNDASVLGENPSTYTIESDNIILINPTKTWYTFIWWSGTGIEWLTWTVVIPNGSTWDRNYEANWEINQYTITLDIDGTLTAITWDYGSPINKPSNPSKNWYTFKWWEPEIPDTMPAEDMTIKAKWERNWSSGWWGWWGWGSSSSSTGSNTTPGSDTSNNTWNQQTWSGANSSTGTQNEQPTSWTKINEPEANTGSNIQTWNQVDTLEQAPQNDNSNTQDSSPSSQNDGKTYTPEFQQAYEFAKWHWITTMPTIQKADMNWKLTRIAMAKMLSQYAINVLWKTPDTTQNNKFNDVTDKQNSDYDDWVTLAYQLGIMWQNMPNNKFRPDDEVTRAEFATALSRMIYWTSDWEYKSTDKYYVHHMEKLVEKWIITKDDPKMKELRWYVMIMLMRSAK